MIFGVNTTRDISKLSQISLVKLRITISKYHSWYLCQISLQIMLLPIQTYRNQVFLRMSHVLVPFHSPLILTDELTCKNVILESQTQSCVTRNKTAVE